MATHSRRSFIKHAGGAAATGLAGGLIASGCLNDNDPLNVQSHKKPNVIVLFTDDMGYGDWTRGGHPTIKTPNLNRMANEGVHLTQFYSGNPVCSPSRSALLTGRNCIRTGVVHVFFPPDKRGMSTDEITIADSLKEQGYRTACIGKWHLGHEPEYRPMRQGFDYYYGILYSNDMENPDIYRNDEMVEHPTDQTTLTPRYTREAVTFIEESGDDPFFLYLPYSFPHVPLYASENFRGKSVRGLYGDVIEEIDWSVGVILDTLKRLEIDDNTLVIFTSDNGPWMTQNINGGTAGSLRGAKGDTWEGGMRVPAVAWWPGRLPAGSINTEVCSVIDLFPTIAGLAGAEIPSDRPIDGIDIMPVLEGTQSVERPIFYYRREYLCAVRKGRWKLHFYYMEHSGREYTYGLANLRKAEKPLLFDLDTDPSERFDLADKHPDIVNELSFLTDSYIAEVERNGENDDLIDWFLNEQSRRSKHPGPDGNG